jgi:hypothetical protein
MTYHVVIGENFSPDAILHNGTRRDEAENVLNFLRRKYVGITLALYSANRGEHARLA